MISSSAIDSYSYTLLNSIFYLQWLKDKFSAYLDEWEKSVMDRPGFKDDEKKNLMLRSETLLGLQMTGKSFKNV